MRVFAQVRAQVPNGQGLVPDHRNNARESDAGEDFLACGNVEFLDHVARGVLGVCADVGRGVNGAGGDTGGFEGCQGVSS